MLNNWYQLYFLWNLMVHHNFNYQFFLSSYSDIESKWVVRIIQLLQIIIHRCCLFRCWFLKFFNVITHCIIRYEFLLTFEVTIKLKLLSINFFWERKRLLDTCTGKLTEITLLKIEFIHLRIKTLNYRWSLYQIKIWNVENFEIIRGIIYY